MKKGFTLIELMGVIIILGVLALITYPVIDKSIKQSKEKSLDRTIESIIEASYNYSIKNDLGYNSNYKKLEFETLAQAGYIEKEIINPVTNQKLEGCIIYRWNNSNNQYEFEYSETCEVPLILYKDNSGANSPELLNNMIPIYYNGTNWIYANIYEEWYDYDKKEWANAVVLNDNVSKNVGDTISEDEIALWYVWIPRYTYTIFNGNNESVNEQEIQIKFENGTNSSGTVECVDAISGSGTNSETCTDDTNGSIKNGTSTYTHPAFTFGDKELTGFWVGKFELSTTDTTCNTTPNKTNCDKIHTINTKPNISSLRFINVSNLFTSIQNVSLDFSLNGDSHIMKNMEWGAVAYLSHSKYGIGNKEIGLNNNTSYITGCGAEEGTSPSNECNKYDTTLGILASTTGNIYGIYDMSGGAYEYIMGNMVDTNGNFYNSNAGFNENYPNSKYYDSYTYNTSYITHERGKLGDATKEILKSFGTATGGWYGNNSYFPSNSRSWFIRGGNNTVLSYQGIFNFYYYYGNASDLGDCSSRIVIISNS